jgi:hypothetical protein
MTPEAAGLLFVIFFVTGALMYLLPTIIARVRNHRQTGPICVINMLLGWTFLAWVVCLAWSLTSDVEAR